MKIAYIIPSLANKGPILVVKDLVQLFTKYGHECTVFYFDNKQELTMNCECVNITENDVINFDTFDIVHSHCYRSDKYAAKVKPNFKNTKFITTLHNYALEDFKYEYNWFIALVFGNLWMYYVGKLNRIVTLSKNAMSYYRRWFTDDKLDYAYNVRCVDFNEVLSPEENDELLLFKGDFKLIGINSLLTPRKGVDMIIKALKQLDGFKLVIVGDGVSRTSLEGLADKYCVRDRCLFLGYKLMAHRYLTHYDVYAMPSRSEGFALVLLEAAAYKTCAVCSDIPIFKELFDETEVAFFELEDIDGLVKAIKKVSENSAFGENLHKKCRLDYSPDNFYNKYLHIYENTI